MIAYALRAISFVTTILLSTLFLLVLLLIFCPLRLISKRWFLLWARFLKKCFVQILLALTNVYAPSEYHIVTDENDRNTVEKLSSTNLNGTDILISNHQIYTDWTYIWFFLLSIKRASHLIIILKDSLKNIPVIGWVFLYLIIGNAAYWFHLPQKKLATRRTISKVQSFTTHGR